MKNHLVFPAILMLTFSSLFAQDNSQSKFVAPQVDEQCKEILMSYFPKTIVTEVLTQNNVPKDKVAVIADALAKKSSDVLKIVQDKASKMNPNPLKDPNMHEQTGKLIRDTVLEIFGSVMKDNGVTDNKQIQSMADAIQQKKADLFKQCMDKAQPEDESDDEDYEDDEDDLDDEADDKADFVKATQK